MAGTSGPSAILANALLIVSCVLREATWSRRVAFDAVWQSLYLFTIFSSARKIMSERTQISCSLRRLRKSSSEFAGEYPLLYHGSTLAGPLPCYARKHRESSQLQGTLPARARPWFLVELA